MSSESKDAGQPHPAEPVTITINPFGVSIRFNDPNPETRYRPLTPKEIKTAIQKAEQREEQEHSR